MGSQIWATYALLDPSYADMTTFGFWIDVGNGHFFLLPSLALNVAMTFDAGLPPRVVGIVGIVFNYVMMHGTFLYFASYLLNRRYQGCSRAAQCVVAFANGLW